jgi:hypothetical protein
MPAHTGGPAGPADGLRGGVLMRTMFVVYLVVIVLGLACSLVIGLLGV